MKQTTHKAVLVLAGLIFAVSCGMLIRHLFQYRQGELVYGEAAQLAGLTAPTNHEPIPNLSLPLQTAAAGEEDAERSAASYVQILEEMNFASLREVNEDVLGWIVIPDTNLSYPLLQGEDNSYYLSHTWDNSRNEVGSIFADFRSSKEFHDFHTIIYGHRMNNETMFGQLHKYKDPAYCEEHPIVYIVDDSGSRPYEIFSVYIADSMETYRMEFADDAEKREFIGYTISRTWIDTGIVPEVTDKIITLSTCTGGGYETRFVVHAVLREV